MIFGEMRIHFDGGEREIYQCQNFLSTAAWSIYAAAVAGLLHKMEDFIDAVVDISNKNSWRWFERCENDARSRACVVYRLRTPAGGVSCHVMSSMGSRKKQGT